MYAWHPSWIRPYESMWGVTERFCLLNLPEPDDLWRILGEGQDPEAGKRRKVDTTKNGYLRFDKSKCEAVLGVPEDFYDAHFGPHYRLDIFTPDELNLKYCPICMRKLFHTPIFQAAALKVCPIHLSVLRTSCPKCRLPIASQFATRQNSKFSGYCSCDGFPWEAERLSDVMLGLSVGDLRTLSRFCWRVGQVAKDERRRTWLADRIILGDGDRTAYGLFAQAIGMPPQFVELFHTVPARVRYRGNVSKLQDAVVHADRQRSRDVLLLMQSTSPDRIVGRTLRGYFEHLAFVPNRYVGPRDTLGNLGQQDLLGAKEPWGIPGALAAYPAYDRWIFLWEKRTFEQSTGRRHEGGITAFGEAYAGAHSIEMSRLEYRTTTEAPGMETFRWCFRKMFVAMFIHTLAWTVKWCDAVRRRKLRVTSLNWEGFGAWSFPRCYYLPMSGDFASAAMFITSPDVMSPRYKAQIWEACWEQGGPDFTEFLSVLSDKEMPSLNTQGGWFDIADQAEAETAPFGALAFSQLDLQFDRKPKRKERAETVRRRYKRFDTGAKIRIMPL